MYISGKVVLITGGSRGIGASTARLLADAGAAVAVVGRHSDSLQTVVGGIEAAGGKALGVVADVADHAATRHMVEATIKHFGRLDYAVNSAGIGGAGGFLDLDVAEYDRIMDVNARGVFLSMQAELTAMLATGGGAIVNVASVGGLVGIPNIAHYVASKHAVIGMTRAAALEFADRGVRINAVAPGVTATELVMNAHEAVKKMLTAGSAMGRMAEPAEIAKAIAYLLVDATFATGTVLSADGGQTAS